MREQGKGERGWGMGQGVGQRREGGRGGASDGEKGSVMERRGWWWRAWAGDGEEGLVMEMRGR